MNGRQQLPNLKRERNDHVDLDRAVFKVHASRPTSLNYFHATRLKVLCTKLTFVYSYS